MLRSRSTCLWCICELFFGLFLTIGEAQWNVVDSSCRTPDRGTGDCLPIAQCKHMVNLLQTLKRPISPSVSKEIRAYECGADSGGYKVCCPPKPIILNAEPTTLFHERTTPPDITNHRNIKLLPETCGQFDSTSKLTIGNGNNSELNEFPWMAILQYRIVTKNNKLDFRCGGTIINKNYILTAAHCLEKSPTKILVAVRVGEHSIQNEMDCEKPSENEFYCNPPVQNLAIEEVILHPEYAKAENMVNDIGLIRVSTIDLTVVNARPVCLPVGVVRDFPYKNVMVTGWGVTNSWSGATADILQKVWLPVFDKAKCIKTYGESNISVKNTQLCVGGVDRYSCGGDSGGPMLVVTLLGKQIIYVQQGIVSYGPRSCSLVDYPGVYTAVKFYMDWILDNIKE